MVTVLESIPNTAVMTLLAFIVTMSELVDPLASPVHPMKWKCAPGLAVSVTWLPLMNVPRLGFLVMLPVPVTLVVRV